MRAERPEAQSQDFLSALCAQPEAGHTPVSTAGGGLSYFNPMSHAVNINSLCLETMAGNRYQQRGTLQDLLT